MAVVIMIISVVPPVPAHHHPRQFSLSQRRCYRTPPLSCSSSSTQDPLEYARGCKACGREEIERGCNGEGRIQGGIATVPGFGWWPIKAYRPCPGLVAAGGRYKRYGQSLDEVGFGSMEMGIGKEIKDEA